MEKNWSRYLHVKIRRILTLFYLSFLIQNLACIVSVASQQTYNASEDILVACGSSGSFLSQDRYRTWTGDKNSPYFLELFDKNNSSRVSDARQQASGSLEPVYSKARLSYSRFTYLFNLTAGQKFIRLYFYPTSYEDFDGSKAFFSVTAGSFTLLRNFSASITAAALLQDTVFKEFCINVEEGQSLKLSFTPSPEYQHTYAFVNGIEIVSMPDNLYYTGDSNSFEFVGQNIPYSIQKSQALETVYRINIGGVQISPEGDTGMYRTWYAGITDYLTDARPGVLLLNESFQPKFDPTPNYTAPAVLYQTAMSMGRDGEIKENYSLTWEFPVDSGFTYFVRLHFCEFLEEITEVGDREFEIYIANLTAETEADVFRWSRGNGIPTYTDYAVNIGTQGDLKKQNLSIALHPALNRRTKYSDAILNGLEIFKVDNHGNVRDERFVLDIAIPKN